MNLDSATSPSVPIEARAERRAERRLLAIAVAVIFCAKCLFALVLVPHFKDQINPEYSVGNVDNYVSLAKSLENGDGYRFFPETSLTLMREPGFPYYLATLKSYFDHFQKIAVVLNIVFSSLCAVLIFHLARSMVAIRWVPVIAAFVFMLHPGVIVAEQRNGIEIPFTLLLLGFLLLTRKALSSDSLVDYVKVGVALGAISLVRSTALLFPTFLIFYGFIFKGGWPSVIRSVPRIALIFACALLAMSPWILRNYALVGKFIPTASVQGIAMQAGNYICVHENDEPKKTFHQLDDDAADVRNTLARQQGYRFKASYYQYFYDAHDEVRFNGSLASAVVDQYRRSPSLFVRCASENIFNFWFQGKDNRATIANMMVQLPFLLLAIAGALLGWRHLDKPTFGLFALFVVYTLGVYIPIHAQARYSIPIMPLLTVLAAIPIARCVGFLSRRPGSAPVAHARW